MATAKYHVGDRVVLTASLFMVALSLAIFFVFLMFAPPAHGVVPMKKKISVSEQWLATCSRAPRFARPLARAPDALPVLPVGLIELPMPATRRKRA
jgi:hypothetical protein